MIVKHNIVFEITNECNMRCKHCYNRFDDHKQLQSKDIVSFLKMFGKHDEFPSVIITGGEPLLYVDLIRLINEISSTNCVRLNTNGLFLHKYLDRLKTIPGLKIQVSLDGYDKDTYYKIRKCNCFDKVIDNIIYAKNEGLNVSIRTTLTKATIKEYERFIELANRIGVSIIIRPMIFTGKDEQNELLYSENDLFWWIEDSSNKSFKECLNKETIESNRTCSLLSENPYIGSLYVKNDGSIFPCQLLTNSRYYMGNITEITYESLQNVLTNIGYIYRKDIISPQCITCGKKNKIGNGTCYMACFLNSKKCNMKLNIGDF